MLQFGFDGSLFRCLNDAIYVQGRLVAILYDLPWQRARDKSDQMMVMH